MLRRTHQHAITGRRVLAGIGSALHWLATAVTFLMAVELCDGRPLNSAVDTDAEAIVAVVHRGKTIQARARHLDEPVFTAHHHARVIRVVPSTSALDIAPVEGHRLANGLMAPLRR